MLHRKNRDRHFRLTRAIAHTASAQAQTYLRVLFVARMKSHIQLKRSCSIGYSSFNPSFLFTSTIFKINNAVYVNRVSQVLVTMARTLPKTEGQFYWAFFVSVFSLVSLELPKLILYTTLNVKFLPFVQIHYNEF